MTLYPFAGRMPVVADSAFVAPGARLIGNVTIGEDASVWYNCVLRGDVSHIVLGARSNIQDGSIVHCNGGQDGSSGQPTIIGEDVLIGHLAMIHGCVIENGGFVGMGGIVMDGCTIEAGGMLAAGAMLTPGKRIGRNELWTGRPAKFTRLLTDEDIARNRYGVSGYLRLAKAHKTGIGI